MRSQKRKVQFLRSARQPTAAVGSWSLDARNRAASDMAHTDDEFEPFMAIAPHLCHWPPIIDRLSTETSKLQARTIEECLPLLTAVNNPASNPFDFDEYGLPSLHRQTHVDFVHNGLEPLPAQFVAMDASRPWLMYWSLLSLYIMGEDVTAFRSRYVYSKTWAWVMARCGKGLIVLQHCENFPTSTESVRWIWRRTRPPFPSGRNVRGDPRHSHGWWRRSLRTY